MVRARKKIGQHSLMNCSNVGHSYEPFVTYLLGWNILSFLWKQKFFCWSLKYVVTGYIGTNEMLITRRPWSVRSHCDTLAGISVKFNRPKPRITVISREEPVTAVHNNSKVQQKIFLLAVSGQMELFCRNRYVNPSCSYGKNYKLYRP